jgi:hypothetical protein
VAIVQGDDAVGALAYVGVVGDEDDGFTGGDEFVEELEDLLACFGIERAGGFIGQENEGFIDHGSGDADALLLAA